MEKLIYKNKINLYNDYKKGLSINKFKVTYLIRFMDIHGFDILKTSK